MEPPQRNALIVLGIATLVVVGVLVFGVMRADDSQRDDPQRVAREWKPGGLAGRAAAALAARGPKLELARREFRVPGGRDSGPVDVPPAASAGDKFRRGTFVLHAGRRAEIVYDDRTPDKGSGFERFEHQTVAFPPGEDEPSRRRADGIATGAIVALRGGGTLRLRCLDPTPCVFLLD